MCSEWHDYLVFLSMVGTLVAIIGAGVVSVCWALAKIINRADN